MPNPRAVKEISIHALREEGDHRSLFRSAQKIDFYPRPPRGGRPTSSLPSWRGGNFYPRPPRGGRPSGRKCDGLSAFHFYPRPPRGGRRSLGVSTLYYAEISIHALREEGDRTAHGISNAAYRFLSTPSARRATGADEGIRQAQAISIHALREEGDVTDSARSPMILSFLSTPSARRATG